MHNVSFEETQKHVPVDALGAIHVYRLHTEFSQFVMDVVENIRERGDLQRIVILVQKGVSKSVIDDATQRIAELLEDERRGEECNTRNGNVIQGMDLVSPQTKSRLSPDEIPPPVRENRKIALECFTDLTRIELRRLKRQWERSRQKNNRNENRRGNAE